MNKSIGIVTKSLGVGGAEKQSLLLARSLKKKYPVLVIVQGKAKSSDVKNLRFAEEEKIDYVFLKGSFFRRAWQLQRIIRKNNIKIVFTYLPIDNLLTGVVSYFTRIEFIGGVRNCTLPPLKKLLIKILHHTTMKYLLFNNQIGKEQLVSEGFSPKKSIVITNFPNTSIPPPRHRKPSETIKIITVSRYNANKDYLTSLRAIRFLLDNFKLRTKLKYFAVGWGPLEDQLRSWIRELELEPYTELVRMPKSVDPYLEDADIYLCSSILEGFSNSIMEALGHSLPVIATDVGDNKYMVRDGHNGFITKPGAFQVMAAKLNELIEDPVKRTEFGIKGYELLNSEFSTTKIENQYISLIDSIK
ncbi:MAG: glycosyltransferase [Bacteroidales bacterium]|nr:glycosyltransferase [Bacteroidales bacterium]